MRASAIVAGWFGLLAGSVGWAYEIEDVRIESWSGAGDSVVLLVVDFWPGDGDANSFAFGHRFSDPQITGLDLLDALHAADNGFTYAHSDGFVTDIWYDREGTTYHAGYDWPDSFWSYHLSSHYGESWEFAMYGPAGRSLHDGDTDGWLAKDGYDYESVPVTPLAIGARGDLNCDGRVDGFDIDPFVLALTAPADYQQQYPGCERMLADIDGDGQVTGFDIEPFVYLLSG